MERSGVGGQAGVTKRIYNYPSFHEGIEKLKPRSGFIFIDLGFIVTDKAMETSLEGVFAAGDARGLDDPAISGKDRGQQKLQEGLAVAFLLSPTGED